MMTAKFFKIVSYLMLVISPVVPALVWLGIFVVANLVTEIWQQSRQKKLSAHSTERMLINLISSIVVYFIFIIVARGFDLTVLPTRPLPFTAVQIAISICSVREIKPILENVGYLLGVNLWEYFKNKVKTDAEK